MPIRASIQSMYRIAFAAPPGPFSSCGWFCAFSWVHCPHPGPRRHCRLLEAVEAAVRVARHPSPLFAACRAVSRHDAMSYSVRAPAYADVSGLRPFSAMDAASLPARTRVQYVARASQAALHPRSHYHYHYHYCYRCVSSRKRGSVRVRGWGRRKEMTPYRPDLVLWAVTYVPWSRDRFCAVARPWLLPLC